MKPFELELRLRNNGLRSRRRQLGLSQRALANAAHIPVRSYCTLETMREAPVNAAGEWRVIAIELARFHGVAPESLFPAAVLEVSESQAVIEVDRGELAALLAPDRVALPSDTVEQRDSAGILTAALENLTERERGVLLRTVIDEDGSSEVARDLGVSCERVRQIERKALRKLKGALFEDAREFYDDRTAVLKVRSNHEDRDRWRALRAEGRASPEMLELLEAWERGGGREFEQVERVHAARRAAERAREREVNEQLRHDEERAYLRRAQERAALLEKQHSNALDELGRQFRNARQFSLLYPRTDAPPPPARAPRIITPCVAFTCSCGEPLSDLCGDCKLQAGDWSLCGECGQYLKIAGFKNARALLELVTLDQIAAESRADLVDMLRTASERVRRIFDAKQAFKARAAQLVPRLPVIASSSGAAGSSAIVVDTVVTTGPPDALSLTDSSDTGSGAGR